MTMLCWYYYSKLCQPFAAVITVNYDKNQIDASQTAEIMCLHKIPLLAVRCLIFASPFFLSQMCMFILYTEVEVILHPLCQTWIESGAKKRVKTAQLKQPDHMCRMFSTMSSFSSECRFLQYAMFITISPCTTHCLLCGNTSE